VVWEGVRGGFRSFLSNWGALCGKKIGFTKFGVDLDGQFLKLKLKLKLQYVEVEV
jgi:hypothetical protein